MVHGFDALQQTSSGQAKSTETWSQMVSTTALQGRALHFACRPFEDMLENLHIFGPSCQRHSVFHSLYVGSS